jgi:uncharacterized membrane protein YcaP (DUF421 family)
MKLETVDLDITDWKRILLGEAPAEFLLEVLIRALVIYIVLIVVLNLMGKRMTGQLALADFAIMITMGGIVSVPMQVPESGILLGIVVLFCALFFHKGFNMLSRIFPKFEDSTHGKVAMLVKNGIIQCETMKTNKISQQQLFAALRNDGLYNLGLVRRVYLEPYGQFSILRFNDSRAGLCIVPQADQECDDLKVVDEKGKIVCSACGAVIEIRSEEPCSSCQGVNFVGAII